MVEFWTVLRNNDYLNLAVALFYHGLYWLHSIYSFELQ